MRLVPGVLPRPAARDLDVAPRLVVRVATSGSARSWNRHVPSSDRRSGACGTACIGRRPSGDESPGSSTGRLTARLSHIGGRRPVRSASAGTRTSRRPPRRPPGPRPARTARPARSTRRGLPADDVGDDRGDAEGDRLEQRLTGRLEVARQDRRDGQDDADDDAGEGQPGHDPRRRRWPAGTSMTIQRPCTRRREGAGAEDAAQPEAADEQAAMTSMLGISASGGQPGRQRDVRRAGRRAPRGAGAGT